MIFQYWTGPETYVIEKNQREKTRVSVECIKYCEPIFIRGETIHTNSSQDIFQQCLNDRGVNWISVGFNSVTY